MSKPDNDAEVGPQPFMIPPNSGSEEKVMAHLGDLQSGDANVRMFAVLGLADTDDECAVPALIGALQDRSPFVRAAAAAALGRVGNNDAVPALLAMIGDDREVRACAATALGEIGDVRAFPALIAMVDDDWEECANRARTALKQIGAPAVLACFKIKGINRFAEVLRVFGDESTVWDVVLADRFLTPEDKLSVLETIRQYWYFGDFYKVRYIADLKGHCREIVDESDGDDELCAGALSVLALLDRQTESQQLLRASEERSDGHAESLLRPAADTAHVSVSGLLQSSSAPTESLRRRPGWLRRLFSR